MDPVEEIRRLAGTCIGNESQFIVDVKLSSRKGPKKLLVIVDGDEGVSIDDCAAISRGLSKALDDAGMLEDQYLLEVSTPGVDQPLTLERQYRKHVGRRLKVTTGGVTHEGLLESLNRDGIVLTGSSGKGKSAEAWRKEIPFSGIEKAFVLVSFK
ncbi:MAG TPA: hypothetical protein VKZ75_04465 [Cyclobacteriaceae bacterium]|nr:hypothetical protein [Cyclobacteriaceae bacterium]